jgi:pimeloyl-ACP methyl ester carboxylesterase
MRAPSVILVLVAALRSACEPLQARRPARARSKEAPRRFQANTRQWSQMYYEIHGTGEPLVLLPGGIATIDNSFGKLIPTIAKHRQVIALEQQGHGHTRDIDRPLTYEQMAEDTVALLRQLKIEKADFFGWSVGGVFPFRSRSNIPSLLEN